MLVFISMQTFESDRDLQAEITANIENLQQFYGLSSVNSLKQLVEIILDPKRSQLLFRQRNITLASIFQDKHDPTQVNMKHVKVFAQKYSYEKLVQKFPKPKGETNRMLITILQQKLAREPIMSHQTRKTMWMLVSGARFNMYHHKGLYQQLLAYDSYPDYFNRSIKQDINRTVAKSQTSEGELKALQNVLIAFSRRNPYVGYCQGLNFVANFLLTMQFTEEEAFWLLSQIIETVIPMDYYTNMIGVVCDQQVFLAILAKIHPEITNKFDQVGLDPSVLSIEWFVCLFTSSLPFYLVKVVWDRLLVEGSKAFIKTGLIIMGYFKSAILEVRQFHEIILLLQKGTKSLNLPQAEFNQLFQKIYISREGLILARTLYRQYHLKEKLSDNLFGKKRQTQQVYCNPKWPICTVLLEKNRRQREENEIWIFRTGQPPHIDPQYLLRNKNKLQQHRTSKIRLDEKNQKASPLTPIYGDLPRLKTIREVRQSYAETQSKGSKQWTTEADLVSCDHSELTIGRLQHICHITHRESKEHEEQQHIENKNHRKDRRSVIIIERQEENKALKTSNLKKIMELNESNNEGEDLDEEQMIQRSQTIKFFSKFLNENVELSNIIMPSTKDT